MKKDSKHRDLDQIMKDDNVIIEEEIEEQPLTISWKEIGLIILHKLFRTNQMFITAKTVKKYRRES